MARRIVTRKRTASRRRPRADQFSFTWDTVCALIGDGDGTQIRNDYRKKAWQVYESISMPTTSDEPWRRTDLRRLEAGSFRLPSPEAHLNLSPVPGELLTPLVGEQHGGQMVLLPGGGETIELHPRLVDQGVVFTDFQTAERQYPQILADILGKIINPEAGKFAALTGALAQNGILVYVPRGVAAELPLHSVYWGPGLSLAHLTHLLVWVEEGASLTYVHEAASPTDLDGQALHAGLVEIHVGAGANLRFVELQSWGEQVWSFTHERARVQRDGNLDWIYGGIGTRLSKNFMDLDLEGQGASARMSGFFFTDGVQHLDLDTQQNHRAPNTSSDLLYKGALAGESRTVWQGMIYVAPGAQQTDGYQANRNLVLSRAARADSIPGLEILADDVRCTHGATIGKIDEDLLFYLRSRGLSLPQAERLYVEGFFDEVMQRIPFEGVRRRFEDAILEKMNGDLN